MVRGPAPLLPTDLAALLYRVVKPIDIRGADTQSIIISYDSYYKSYIIKEEYFDIYILIIHI